MANWIHKWIFFNNEHKKKWAFIILSLVSVSFVTTDWMVGIFTFSDYLFGFTLLLLFLSGNFIIKKNQIYWLSLIVMVVVSNITFHYTLNEAFLLKTGVAALVKIIFYSVYIVGIFNYVKDEALEEKLLRTLIVTAVLICIIGIYITLAIYSDFIPYEFFWQFTRKDLASYIYGWDSSLVRTRSVFSEPSYLGYYLNIILGIILFNQNKLKINKKNIYLIIFTILLTFSYSSIGVLFFNCIIYFLKNHSGKNLKWRNRYLIILLVIVIFVFTFWNLINETIIQRTISILNGTDRSTLNRILNSWEYVNKDNIFFGRGVNHTPDIWNNYAYILSDFGIIAFTGVCIFSVFLISRNRELGFLFIILNFQKGGYLSNAFWILCLIILIFSRRNKISQKLREKYET